MGATGDQGVGFWRWRIDEAAKRGRVLLGSQNGRRVEALRLVVSEEIVDSPLGLGAPARGIVGMLVVVLTGPVSEDGEAGPLQCRIDNAYVRPGLRRRGHASRMVQFLSDWARTLDVQAIDLQVAQTNVLGIAAWSGLGFRRSGDDVGAGFIAMSRAFGER